MLILALLTIALVGYLLWQLREQPAAPKLLGLTFVGGILVWLATMSWPLGPHGDYLPWDDTGLRGVGLIMVVLGAGTSLALVGRLTGVLGQRRAA